MRSCFYLFCVYSVSYLFTLHSIHFCKTCTADVAVSPSSIPRAPSSFTMSALASLTTPVAVKAGKSVAFNRGTKVAQVRSVRFPHLGTFVRFAETRRRVTLEAAFVTGWTIKAARMPLPPQQ